jgi:hypothetical protein
MSAVRRHATSYFSSEIHEAVLGITNWLSTRISCREEELLNLQVITVRGYKICTNSDNSIVAFMYLCSGSDMALRAR